MKNKFKIERNVHDAQKLLGVVDLPYQFERGVLKEE